MRFRSVLQEFEAILEPVPGGRHAGARGKAEWKTYGDGTRRSKLTVSRLDLPDGTVLDLLVNQQRQARVTLEGGTARFRRETEHGEDVSTVESGDILQVVHGGQVILAGRFYAE
jgi:hypothetical protein